ncbi:MAG TPA: methyltransferase [Alphaproteobacteria bacterium]|jgi:precorrin-6B methylase 2|nr:methyltransferase [Alphaproteobacteria bacterium]
MHARTTLPNVAATPQADEPDVDLWALTDLAVPYAIRVAATMRLADHVAGGTTRLADLAAKTGVPADLLGRLMRFLGCRGIFRETAPDVFAMTKTAEKLKDDHPSHLRQWIDLTGMGGRMDVSFGGLLDSIRTGEPAYPKIFGVPFYDDTETTPEKARAFGALMAIVSSWYAGAVAKLDWSGVNHLVDVGGGTGTLLSSVLRANPAMRGTLFDQPATAPVALESFKKAGLADRCTVASGSYLDPLPKGGDVYMLSQIVHNLSDPEAEVALRRCAEAAGPGGRVLVVERIAISEKDQKLITSMDLRMLVVLGTRERNVDEFRALGARAGLALQSTQRLTAGMSALHFAVAG